MPERVDQASQLRAVAKGMWVGFGIVAAVVAFGFSVLAGYSTGRALETGDSAQRGSVSTR